MIKVNKKEIEERKFIPYEIIISIDSQEDHELLKKESNAACAALEQEHWRTFLGKSKEYSFVLEVLHKIMTHI